MADRASVVYGTTVVRRAHPEPTWVDITALGDSRPTLLEVWRGWTVELWCDWTWI